MRLVLTILFIASCCAFVRADTKGVIGGRVTDPQNAAVSQAMVVLKKVIDGRTLEGTTSDDGTFEFRFVSAGEYTITVAGFYHHFTKLETDGRADDPSNPLASDNRRANYCGGKVDFSERTTRHLIKLGGEIYAAVLRDDFAVLPNPAHPHNNDRVFTSGVPSRAIEESVYAQDQFDVSDRLTLNLGARLDLFQVRFEPRTRRDITNEYTFVSPRIGFAYRLGRSDTVLFGNFA